MNRGKWLLAMGFCLAAILNSCREDTGSTGANILPPNDQISAYETDTTSVLTSMFLKDSIITDDAVYSGLGSYNDPIFGQYKSSIYAQIFSPVGATTTTIPWANDSVPVDSVVLILPYITGVATSYYGNLDPQTIVVDTLESPIHATNSAGNYVAYYSDTSIKYDAAHPIGMQQIVPLNPYYGHDTAVRVKLKKGWWQSIMNRITNNPNYYTTFDSLVKGLYITVSNSLQLPGQGGILFIYLNQGSFACIDFYYHDKSTPTIPYYVQFPIGGTFFSHIDRSYVTAPFANIHPSGKHDSIPANNLMYVQGAGGVEGRVNFPNLYKNWQGKKNILINKAEVDFTVDIQDCPSPFVPSSQLYLLATDSLGYGYPTPDQTNNGLTGYYGGGYDGYSYTYTFVITQYIQKVIDGKIKDRGMFLYDANPTSPERVVLYGAQHGAAIPTNQRVRLRLYYTPLKN